MSTIADLTAASLRTQQAKEHAEQEARTKGLPAYEVAKADWLCALRDRNRIAVELQPAYAERIRQIGEQAWAEACERWPEVRPAGMVETTQHNFATQ